MQNKNILFIFLTKIKYLLPIEHGLSLTGVLFCTFSKGDIQKCLCLLFINLPTWWKNYFPQNLCEWDQWL